MAYFLISFLHLAEPGRSARGSEPRLKNEIYWIQTRNADHLAAALGWVKRSPWQSTAAVNVKIFWLQNEEGSNCFVVLDRIVPHLYDLTHVTPQNASHCVVEVLKEKQQDFRAHCKSFPGLDVVCFRELNHKHTNVHLHVFWKQFLRTQEQLQHHI